MQCRTRTALCVAHALQDDIDVDSESNADEIVCTADDCIRRERYPCPRGSSPLGILPLDEAQGHRELLAEQEGLTQEQLVELLVRGATEAMIKRFRLRFTYCEGITATADDDLLYQYTTDNTPDVCTWILCLGRQLTLEPGDDEGNRWMSAFVEDVMGTGTGTLNHWRTQSDSQGVLYTAPIDDAPLYHSCAAGDERWPRPPCPEKHKHKCLDDPDDFCAKHHFNIPNTDIRDSYEASNMVLAHTFA